MFMNCFASLTDLGGHGGLEPMINMNTTLSYLSIKTMSNESEIQLRLHLSPQHLSPGDARCYHEPLCRRYLARLHSWQCTF